MAVRISKRKKNTRQHGKRWHGWGSKKKHRGKGSKGGRGNAGRHKHKFSYVNTVDPYNYGYKGFVPSKVKCNKAINIDDLQKLCGIKKTDTIDLGEFGYTKLLGRGEIKTKLNVKVCECSASAREKIEKAGGKISMEADGNE